MDEKKVKIGVISDTHLGGYDDKLKSIVARHFNDADIILHAGDIVDIGVLDIFEQKEVKAVCGNMDNYKTRERLPEQLIFEVNGFKIGLIHGWGSPGGIEEKILERIGKVDCVVYGHTHKPVNHINDNVLFFNPGSAVQRYFASSSTIGILEIDKELTGRIINI